MKTKKVTGTRAQIERFNEIASIIAKGNYDNCTTLGIHFGCHRETIRSDINYMIDVFNYPIGKDRKRKGYFMKSKFTPLTYQQINQSEVEALHFLESACELLKGTSAEKEIKAALTKVMNAVTYDKSTFPKGWRDIVCFRNSVKNIFAPETFDILFRAAAYKETLMMIYKKPGFDEVPEERTVDIYNLACVDGEWFIFAWDHGREDFRTFIPARISSLEKTGEKFSRRKDYSVDDRLRDCFGIQGGDKMEDILIEFSPRVADHIRQKEHRGQQGLRELENGGVELHLRLSSLVEVARWIMKWGGDAIPTQPPQLEAMVRASAVNILTQLDQRNPPQSKPA